MARKKALRWTKKQMQDTYGEDVAKVMKHKEEEGMVEADENNPDGIVYLIAQKEDEVEDYSRSSVLTVYFTLKQIWELNLFTLCEMHVYVTLGC